MNTWLIHWLPSFLSSQYQSVTSKQIILGLTIIYFVAWYVLSLCLRKWLFGDNNLQYRDRIIASNPRTALLLVTYSTLLEWFMVSWIIFDWDLSLDEGLSIIATTFVTFLIALIFTAISDREAVAGMVYCIRMIDQSFEEDAYNRIHRLNQSFKYIHEYKMMLKYYNVSDEKRMFVELNMLAALEYMATRLFTCSDEEGEQERLLLKFTNVTNNLVIINMKIVGLNLNQFEFNNTTFINVTFDCDGEFFFNDNCWFVRCSFSKKTYEASGLEFHSQTNIICVF